MATFTPRYVNLNAVEAAQLQRRANQVSPLDALLSGAQQGLQLNSLPQKLQDQELARQLNNALISQKINDLQNPEARLARELQEIAVKQQVTNPFGGIVASPAGNNVVATPSAINQTASSLEAALNANPNTPIPTASPGLPITPLGNGNLGFSLDPNIPLQREQDKRTSDLNQLIQKLQIEGQIKAAQPQSFTPGSTVGTIDQIRRGEGIKIPDKTTEPKPFSLSPGEKLFAPDGSVLAENPKDSSTQRPITVSPGSVVIDANGKEIFKNPASKSVSEKPLPIKIAERISDAESAIDNLITLKSYIDNPDVQSISGPVAGRTFGANPFSVIAQNFEGVRGTAKQIIGKYLEGGVLRFEDEKKYEKIVPGLKMLTDTQQNQSQVLYDSLKNKLKRDIESYDKSGYDVSRLRGALDKLDSEFSKSSPSGSTPNITTKEQFDSLPSGAIYLEDGVQYKKP